MATNGVNGAAQNRVDMITRAKRLEDGRALAQDVWSIFKYVPRVSIV